MAGARPGLGAELRVGARVDQPRCWAQRRGSWRRAAAPRNKRMGTQPSSFRELAGWIVVRTPRCTTAVRTLYLTHFFSHDPCRGQAQPSVPAAPLSGFGLTPLPLGCLVERSALAR